MYRPHAQFAQLPLYNCIIAEGCQISVCVLHRNYCWNNLLPLTLTDSVWCFLRCRFIHPCRSMCVGVRDSCAPVLACHGHSWPDSLDCDRFPADEDMCLASLTKEYKYLHKGRWKTAEGQGAILYAPEIQEDKRDAVPSLGFCVVSIKWSVGSLLLVVEMIISLHSYRQYHTHDSTLYLIYFEVSL